MGARNTCTIAVLIPLACLCTGANGADIPVANPGFEADFAADGTFPVPIPQGWSVFDPAGILDQGTNAVGVVNPAGTSFFDDPVPEGRNAALIYLEQRAGTTLAGDPVGLTQTLPTLLAPNTRYTLSVQVGNITSGTGLGAFAGLGFYDLSSFPGYRVELLAGGQVLAADDNSLGGRLGEGRFALSTVGFATGALHPLAGQALGIRLINLNATGSVTERGREVDFDHVMLTAAPVPEPHAWAMLGAGLALVALRRRRL